MKLFTSFLQDGFLDSKRVFSGSEGHTIEIKEGKLTIKHIGSSEFTCMWTPKGKVAQMLDLTTGELECLFFLDLINPSNRTCQNNQFTFHQCLLIGGLKDDTNSCWISGLLKLNHHSKVTMGSTIFTFDGEKIQKK